MAKTMTRQAARTIAAVVPFVKAKLAQDEAVDFTKLLAGVKAETFTDQKPKLLEGIRKLTKGKLAQDASIGELAEMLDLLDSHGVEQDEDVSEAQHEAMMATAQGKGDRKMRGRHADDRRRHADDRRRADDRRHADDEHEDHEEVDRTSQEFHGGGGEDRRRGARDRRADDMNQGEIEREHQPFREGEDMGEPDDYDDPTEFTMKRRDAADEEEEEEFESPGEKLEDLGAETGEDDFEAGQPHAEETRSNEYEWRRGSMKGPVTDKRRGMDRRRGMDKRYADDRRHADDRRKGMDKRRAADKRGRAMDEPPPFKGRPNPGGSMDKRRAMDRRGHAQDARETVTRVEMEAAIQAAAKAATARERAIRDAERRVQPYIGNVNMSFDSANAVYEHALKLLKIDTKGVHPSAFPTLLKYAQKPGANNSNPRPAMAADSISRNGTQSFFNMFPDARRLRIG
jgi:hypothetical protein